MNELFEKLHDVYVRKNADYGDSFTQSLFKWGDVAYFVRAEDKLNRYKSLRNNGSKRFVYDETVRDTLEDLLNYTIMYIMYYHEELSYYYTYKAEDNAFMHKVVSKRIDRAPKTDSNIFEEFEELINHFKGKCKAVDKIQQAIMFATSVRDEIYRLQNEQDKTIVARLKKVKKNNLMLIDINKKIEELTNEMIADIFNEKEYKQESTYNIPHEQLYKAVEIDEWFTKLFKDLEELSDKQSGILVDKVVLEYPNDFIMHRYKISEGYIHKLLHENSK